MNIQHDPTSDTPALLPIRRRDWALAVASLALVAGHAIARDVAPAPDPQVVEVELDTDCLYWDLCVGKQQGAAARQLAERIAEGMNEPDALYVISLPQLRAQWMSPGADTMNGLHDERISRRQLALYRSGYEGQVENALIDVIGQVEKLRPGARLSISGFRPMEVRNQRGEFYDRLSNEFTYVTLDERVDFSSSREFDRWLSKMNLDDDMAALVRTNDGWVLAGEDSLIDGLAQPLDQSYVSAWPDDDALDGPLSSDTIEDAAGDDDNVDGNRISMAPDGEESDGSTAIAHGLRRLSQLELVQHEQRVALSTTPPVSNRGEVEPPEEDGPEGGDGPEETPGEGEIDPPEETPGESGVPVLIAGAGFTRATPQPSVVGSPAMPGYSAKVMARWDVVPFQTIDEPFDIGVVAFHINGIATVEFSLNNGPWAEVTMPEYNERTRVWEYTATVDPTRLEDGLYEIRARVTPKDAGIPRVLGGEITEESVGNGEHSMILSSNANQTLATPTRYVSGFGSDSSGDGSRENPFRSISAALADIQSDAGRRTAGAADGAQIYCFPGEYSWGPKPSTVPLTENRWATIEPVPGVLKEDVVFVDSTSSGFKTRLIHVKNVTARHPVQFASSGREKFLWFDGVDAVGDGRVTDVRFVHGSQWTGMYVTGSYIAHTKHGAQHAILIRDTRVHDISNDAFSMGRLVVNCEVDGIEATGTDAHPDVYQLKGDDQTHENFIVYGLSAYNCRSQGLFADGGERFDNVAFVNVLLERRRDINTNGGLACQWKDVNTNHLLMRGVTFEGFTYVMRTNSIENLSVVGCIFNRFKLGSTGDGVPVLLDNIGGHAAFRDNHFTDVTSYGVSAPGTGVTSGDPEFCSPDERDYRPRPSSVLALHEIDIEEFTSDLSGQSRGHRATRGALERSGH